VSETAQALSLFFFSTFRNACMKVPGDFKFPLMTFFFHRVPLDPDIRDTAVASRLTAVVAGLV
jgi:hypothetical protein